MLILAGVFVYALTTLFSDEDSFLSAEQHFGLAMRVLYEEERPQISVYGGDIGFDKLKKYLLTKTRQWEYEVERRLVKQGLTGDRAFPERCLTGIIFGKDIHPTDRTDVIDWIRGGSTPVEFFQADDSQIGIQIAAYTHP